MDLRTQTSLFCGALALAIAVSILLRGRPRRAQYLFAAFAANVGLWYLAQWLYLFMRADVWVRFTIGLAALLPQTALHLFEAVVPRGAGKSRLLRVAGILLIPMLVVVVLPEQSTFARYATFAYVVGLLTSGLWALAQRGVRSGSRAIQRRVKVLVWLGALAMLFSLADFLWFIGAPLPPVGAVLSIVLLFMLAESLVRQRLLDLLDVLLGLLVSTALAFGMAGIFYVFVVLFGGFETMYLGATLAAIVILVLVEPFKAKLEKYAHLVLLRERAGLERAVEKAKVELQHVLEVEQLEAVVMGALGGSRRVTGAAIYWRDPLGSELHLGASHGPTPPERLEAAVMAPLVQRLSATPSLVLDELRFEAARRWPAGFSEAAEFDERLLVAARALGPFVTGVCLAISGGRDKLLGLLFVMDDRVRDAFAAEEVLLLEGLASQVGVALQNSREYRRRHDRDRLAALGQMAAGLAHEVRNPLGAIKGAAQLLGDKRASHSIVPQDREFLDIILQEVDRLNRVVDSVLSYARPQSQQLVPLDVNEVVRSTVQVISSDPTQACEFDVLLASSLPPVRGDAEQLRQVLLNLIKNAAQAMDGGGVLTLRTRLLPEENASGGPDQVEIAVSDTGRGLSEEERRGIFVPFFTTKPKGTGLGLAISQRIVQEMAGRLEVFSQLGQGSTFALRLPALSVTECRPADGTEVRADVAINGTS